MISGRTATAECLMDRWIPAPKSSRTDLDSLNEFGTARRHEQRTSTQLEDRESTSQKLRKLFRAASEEVFEEGMHNNFSRALVMLLATAGESALDHLAPLLTDYLMNEEVAAEAVRWLGRIEQDTLYRKRLWLVERCLYSDSVRIRDAALLALASLDDPTALPYLRGAITIESCDDVKRDMEEVERQLTTTLHCA